MKFRVQNRYNYSSYLSEQLLPDAPYFFDSHCHWDHVVDAFDKKGCPQESLLKALEASKLAGMVIPGIAPEQWPKLLQRVNTIKASTARPLTLGFALGWHPWYLPEYDAASISLSHIKCQLSERLAPFEHEPLWVAIGESGLDAMRPVPMAIQLQWLEAHLQLADALQKPVILHCVRAHQPLMDMLKRYSPCVRGVVHAFSGSYELGQSYRRLGFYLGIGGTCTYSRAKKIHRAIEQLPLECLLLETDAPWMPLQGEQGQPNHPNKAINVAKRVAELKKASLTEVAKRTHGNALNLFFS